MGDAPRPSTIAKMSTASALAEMLRARAERLDRFAEWEKSHPPRLTPSVAIAAAGALYQLLPLASRQRHRYERHRSDAQRPSSSRAMTPLERAIHDITATLDSSRLEYAIIGGIANAVRGEPRATIDSPIPSPSFTKREYCHSTP